MYRSEVVVHKYMLHVMIDDCLQRFAFNGKPQTSFTFERRVCRGKRESYRSANVAAILCVTVMF